MWRRAALLCFMTHRLHQLVLLHCPHFGSLELPCWSIIIYIKSTLFYRHYYFASPQSHFQHDSAGQPWKSLLWFARNSYAMIFWSARRGDAPGERSPLPHHGHARSGSWVQPHRSQAPLSKLLTFHTWYRTCHEYYCINIRRTYSWARRKG